MTICLRRVLGITLITAMQISCTTAAAQPRVYTPGNAHSHNDYAQPSPFLLAYQEHFGSVEADIHMVGGELLVGHDAEDLKPERTLENLYLIPIRDRHDPQRKLQILIDIKTDALPTLGILMRVLQKYPTLITSPNIRFVISGNRPDPKMYAQYPGFIWFDGRLEQQYTPAQLSKIALLSEDFTKLSGNSTAIPLPQTARDRIQSAVNKAHAWDKPTRLWGNPDYPEAWEELMKLGIDYLNTDHIQQLAEYLKNRNKSLKSLP